MLNVVLGKVELWVKEVKKKNVIELVVTFNNNIKEEDVTEQDTMFFEVSVENVSLEDIPFVDHVVDFKLAYEIVLQVLYV